MRFSFPSLRHNRTEFIVIDTSRCEACSRCEEECPAGVLKVKGFRFHRHVHINRAKDCRGCFKCVKACDLGAISPVKPSTTR